MAFPCVPVIDENLNEQVLEPGYVSDTLRKSPDPAKFVLDLILWLYSTQKKMDGSGFEGTVLRHYSLLLGQLKEVSPKISPQIKEEAAKLAFEWKNYKFRTVIGDSAEVICFLQFLAIYELVSWFQREEILRVLLAVMQHKMAPEICWLLGFTDLVPSKFQFFFFFNIRLYAYSVLLSISRLGLRYFVSYGFSFLMSQL